MKSRFAMRAGAAAAALMIAAGLAAVPAFAAPKREKARSNEERDSQTMNSVYLLPDSDTYYITEADISWMDDEELMLARNEFYARRGRKFSMKSIRVYFNRQGWYKGTIEPEDFSNDVFNRYELANIDFIVEYEKKRAKERDEDEDEDEPENSIRRKTKEDDEDEEEEFERIGDAEDEDDEDEIEGDDEDEDDDVREGDEADEFERDEDEAEEYKKIRDLYLKSFSANWTEEEYDKKGVNRLVSGMKKPSELGYTYRDLDGDGFGEFLIGPTNPRRYGEGAVFEIYTVRNGKPVEVVSGRENIHYYVCTDDTLCREKTYRDGSWEIEYYGMTDKELILKSALVMDEEKGGDEPWFAASGKKSSGKRGGKEAESFSYVGEEDSPHSEFTRVSGDSDDAESGHEFERLDPISYEEASRMRTSHFVEELDLTPFK